MSRARIVHVPAESRFGYRWQWTSADGSAAAGSTFDFFYECIQDARAHGHEVVLARAHGQCAPQIAALPPRGV